MELTQRSLVCDKLTRIALMLLKRNDREAYEIVMQARREVFDGN